MYEDKKRKRETRERRRKIIIDSDNKKIKELVVIYVWNVNEYETNSELEQRTEPKRSEENVNEKWILKDRRSVHVTNPKKSSASHSSAEYKYKVKLGNEVERITLIICIWIFVLKFSVLCYKNLSFKFTLFFLQVRLRVNSVVTLGDRRDTRRSVAAGSKTLCSQLI